jgi:peptide/nickel transport system substrate-binding protein
MTQWRWSRAVAAIAAGVMVFGLAACTPGPNEGSDRNRTVKIGWEGGEILDPENFNIWATNGNLGAGLNMMAESLFYANLATGEIEPWLAEGYKYADDYSSVTLTLRDGVTWSDGEAFTADDVVFTILMVRDKVLPFWGSSFKRWVASAEAVDPTTVRIEFTKPNPRFVLKELSGQITRALVVVPEHIWKDVEDPATFTFYDEKKGWPVYTGPYSVRTATPSEFVYDRRDDWWAAATGFHELPVPEIVNFSPMGSADVAAARLRDGDLDASERLEGDVFKSIATSGDMIAWQDAEPYSWTDPCPRSYAVNTQRTPWNNPNLRRALSYALDREKLAAAELGLAQGGDPAPITLPNYEPIQRLFDESPDVVAEATAFDPEQAKALIEAEGYVLGADDLYAKDGVTLALNWVGPDNWNPGQRTFPLIESYLRAVGIDANTILTSEASDERAVGDFDVTGFSPCGGVVDPAGGLDLYRAGDAKPIGETTSTNFPRWANEDFTRLANEVNALEPGDPAIDGLFAEAFEIWVTEQPALPLYQQARVVPFSTRYWDGWPTEQNPYTQPATHWASALLMILTIQPAAG